MTPQERKVFELALQALTHGGCPPDCKDGMTDSGGVHPWGEAALIPCTNCQTITAIKEALAQPKEQEPVAWISTGPARMIHWTADKPDYGDDWVPLYTTPPQRKPLTNEQIIASNYPDGEENGPTIAAPDFELICFARQIEDAHGIKGD